MARAQNAGGALRQIVRAVKRPSQTGGGGDALPAGLPALGVFRVEEAATFAPGRYLFYDVRNLENLHSTNYRNIDEEGEAFNTLMDSIQACGGVVEPIHLRIEDGRTSIIAGHRRTFAVRKVRALFPETGITLPAYVEVVGESSTGLNRELSAVATNLHRQDLRPIERARTYKLLIDAGMSMNRVAMLSGVDRKVVERSLNILRMRDEAIEFIEDNQDHLRFQTMYRAAGLYRLAESQRIRGDRVPYPSREAKVKAQDEAHRQALEMLRQEVEERLAGKKTRVKPTVKETHAAEVAQAAQKLTREYHKMVVSSIRETIADWSLPKELAKSLTKALPPP